SYRTSKVEEILSSKLIRYLFSVPVDIFLNSCIESIFQEMRQSGSKFACGLEDAEMESYLLEFAKRPVNSSINDRRSPNRSIIGFLRADISREENEGHRKQGAEAYAEFLKASWLPYVVVTQCKALGQFSAEF